MLGYQFGVKTSVSPSTESLRPFNPYSFPPSAGMRFSRSKRLKNAMFLAIFSAAFATYFVSRNFRASDFLVTRAYDP